MSIGNRIKLARKSRGLTQKQLAEKLGVAVIAIQQYEANKRQPKIEQLHKIADILGIPVNKLLYDMSIEFDNSPTCVI